MEHACYVHLLGERQRCRIVNLRRLLSWLMMSQWH